LNVKDTRGGLAYVIPYETRRHPYLSSPSKHLGSRFRGNDNFIFKRVQTLTFAASHEFAEAMSDNVPTQLVNPDWPQAWNDSTGYEIGDKCSGGGTLTASTGSWSVTQYYLNSLHGCSVANYTSP
jgi:hypothetical protein